MAMSATRRALLVIPMISALVLSAACAWGAGISVHRQGKSVYLVSRGNRLLVRQGDQWAPDSSDRACTSLAGGYRLQIVTGYFGSEVRAYHDGKLVGTVSPAQCRDAWLDDDRLWDSHAEANEMRYMHRGAGGLSLFISNLIPRGRSALALLSWRADGPSVRPVLTQHLVRIEVLPRPGIRLVRRLGVPDYAFFASWHMVPRIVPFRGRLLLYTTLGAQSTRSEPVNGLVEISARGTQGPVFARIAGDYLPIGLLAGRYLVLDNPNDGVPHPLEFLDLRTKRLAAIPGPWHGYISPGAIVVPESGDTILISQVSDTPTGPSTICDYLIRLPQGTRTVIPGGEWQTIWDGKVLVGRNREIAVHDLRTGRRMRILQACDPKTKSLLMLMDAIANGDVNGFHRLLAGDPALVNRRCTVTDGSTPLYTAAMYGRVEMAEELIRRGADVHAATDSGATPLHSAVAGNGIPNIADLVEMLITKGADVNAIDGECRTPMAFAFNNRDMRVVELLLEHGARLYVRNRSGESILYTAMKNGGLPIGLAAILKRTHYDVNTPEPNGQTLIFTLTSTTSTDWVQALIDAGADVNVRDNKGKTPLDYAETYNNPNVAQLLREHGGLR